VGKALFHGAILGLRNCGKSVILVTHALHFLSNCDYIYTLHDGHIAEHGTFDQLISNKGEFARLDHEFGGSDSQAPSDEKNQTSTIQSIDKIKSKSAHDGSRDAGGNGKLNGKLIVQERRTTGSVSLKGTFGLLPSHFRVLNPSKSI
jgi:ATP-binding cassette subfamily C (CFTR/MRP) protein 1